MRAIKKPATLRLTGQIDSATPASPNLSGCYILILGVSRENGTVQGGVVKAARAADIGPWLQVASDADISLQ